MADHTAQQENGERETKRRRSAPPALDLQLQVNPEVIIDIVADGDVLLVVNSVNGSQKM